MFRPYDDLRSFHVTLCLLQLATENKPLFDLLNIFAYGTLADYSGLLLFCSFLGVELIFVFVAASGLPALTPAQKLKLQRLTVVSLSGRTHVCVPSAVCEKAYLCYRYCRMNPSRRNYRWVQFVSLKI